MTITPAALRVINLYLRARLAVSVRCKVTLLQLRAAGVLIGGLVLLSCNQREAQFAGNSIDAKAAIVLSEQVFGAGVIGDHEVTYKPAFGTVRESLALRQKSPELIKFRQDSRATKTEFFTQGHPGSVTIKDYPITSTEELDLLVVVDNSSSMAAVQAMLAEGMRDFIDQLGDVDWRIGIITSDNPSNPVLTHGDGCQLYGTDGLPGGQPLVKGDPDASSKFLNTILNIGARGSDYEESILNTYKHLTGTCAYGSNQWMRPNAMLGVLFVTDEDSYCPEPVDPITGIPTRPKDSTSELCAVGQRPQDLASLLLPPRREASSSKVYALTWSPSDVQCYSNAQRPANRILELIGLVGGFGGSICQSNYRDTLRAIATDAARTVRRHFQLPHVPIPDSVVVTIDGMATSDYRIEGSVLILTNVSPTQTNLHISYRHDPVPIFNSVQVAATPDLATLSVEVNGQPLDPNQFSFNPGTREISFVETPPSYAHIVVSYKAGDGLSRRFQLGNIAKDDGPLTVTVDGVETQDFVYDETNQSIEFAVPPGDDREITVSYRGIDSKQLLYKGFVHPSGAQPRSFKAIDDVTGAALTVTREADNLVFLAGDVVDGRKVTIDYSYADRSTPLSYRLPDAPLAGEVEVSADSSPDQCVENVDVSQDMISFHCNADDLRSITFKYKVVEEHSSVFALASPLPPNAFAQVFVDGVKTDKFSVTGTVVTVPLSETKPTSTVRVLVLTRVY